LGPEVGRGLDRPDRVPVRFRLSLDPGTPQARPPARWETSREPARGKRLRTGGQLACWSKPGRSTRACSTQRLPERCAVNRPELTNRIVTPQIRTAQPPARLGLLRDPELTTTEPLNPGRSALSSGRYPLGRGQTRERAPAERRRARSSQARAPETTGLGSNWQGRATARWIQGTHAKGASRPRADANRSHRYGPERARRCRGGLRPRDHPWHWLGGLTPLVSGRSIDERLNSGEAPRSSGRPIGVDGPRPATRLGRRTRGSGRAPTTIVGASGTI
jgi:hypothetical protein